MTDEQQPELRWAPIPPKPRDRGRIWLIVGLVVAALAIVGVLLFLFLPRGETPAPGASETPSPSATASATPAPTSEETEPPVQTEAPPAVDPSVEAFRGQVSAPLQDAGQGLDIVESSTGQDAVSVVDTLQLDTQRLSDTPPPSSISTQWRDGLTAYSDTLTQLREALSSGADSSSALADARAALKALTDLVGL